LIQINAALRRNVSCPARPICAHSKILPRYHAVAKVTPASKARRD